MTVSGRAKTIYIGGQNAINSKGELIGNDDLELQTKQALHNIKTILAAENASFADLVKLNIYLVNGSDPLIGYKALQEMAGSLDNPSPCYSFRNLHRVHLAFLK
ncbi:RidA family protein [Paenibacillus sp. FSL W7-1279]|uniref:RidA family protein n=1 Tax=Paenibacillus sp. FSL W7-1279 TaxID=2921697 RepID=UPI0030D9E06D